MTTIQVFSSPEFGQVTTAVIDGKEYFAATECAKILGYANPKDAVLRHCRWVVKRDLPHPQSPDKTLEVNFIPESDLYRLIVRSNLPEAEKFERWIFEEILPSIRKHGAYLTPDKIEEALLNPDTIIQLATTLKAEREKRMTAERQIETDKPKVVFADAVSVSKSSILVGVLAKILRQNGLDIGGRRLFERLRSENYLCVRGSEWNIPTQKSMDRGLFEIKETVVTHSDGHMTITKTPLVTGRGQIYFINKYIDRLPPEAGGPVTVTDELGREITYC